jgi:elongator complex protein 1
VLALKHLAGLLMITPLGTANVPPPMSFCDVKLESTPVDVAISPSGTRIAVLQHDGVDLVSWAFRPLKTPEVKHKIAQASTGESFRQIRFVDEETMCLLGEDKSCSSVLRRLSLDSSQNVKDDEKYPLRAVGLTLQAAKGTGDVFYEQDGGSVVRYSFKENDQHPSCTFPAACPWMESAVFAEQVNGEYAL